jgi:sec-independent protein translocase protein TatB
MEFLGISFWEFLLIMVVIILVVGPAKVPGIMRTIGTIVRNIRRTTTELTASITREIELDNLKKAAEAEPPPGDKKPAAKPPSSAARLHPPAEPGTAKPAPPAPAPDAPQNTMPAGRSTHDEQ